MILLPDFKQAVYSNENACDVPCAIGNGVNRGVRVAPGEAGKESDEY